MATVGRAAAAAPPQEDSGAQEFDQQEEAEPPPEAEAAVAAEPGAGSGSGWRGVAPLVEAAVNHGGLVLISSWMVKDLIEDGKLVQCLADWQGSLFEESSGIIYAVYQGNKYLKPRRYQVLYIILFFLIIYYLTIFDYFICDIPSNFALANYYIMGD